MASVNGGSASRRGGRRREPLAVSLPPPVARWATAFRELIDRFGTDATAAEKLHYTPGTMSRFLSGNRLPPRELIDTVLGNLADLGHSFDEDEREHVHKLFMAAAQAKNPTTYGRYVLVDERNIAIDRADRLHSQRVELGVDLAELVQERNRLETELAAMRNAHAAERQEWQDRVVTADRDVGKLREQLSELETVHQRVRADIQRMSTRLQNMAETEIAEQTGLQQTVRRLHSDLARERSWADFLVRQTAMPSSGGGDSACI
ncbi:hypothetical protein [Actinomadura geliboluensis]|uniref:hypothetical protein n=1 Tax=Actinomadura geliboluensis TaxID=882440 RepID=UPI00371D6AAF